MPSLETAEAWQRTERCRRESWTDHPRMHPHCPQASRGAHREWLAQSDLIQALAGSGTWKISRTWADGRMMTAHGGRISEGSGPASIKGSVGTKTCTAHEGH